MENERKQRDCRAYGELISAYLDDELSALELVELAAHFKRCPSCNRDLDGLMGVKNALHHAEPFWAKSVPREGFLPALLIRVREEDVKPAPARAPRSIPAALRPSPRFASWAAATALTLLLILGAVSLLFRPDPSLVISQTTGTPPAPFLMAQNVVEDDAEGYLREHAIESSRNLLLDDEYTIDLVDHARP